MMAFQGDFSPRIGVGNILLGMCRQDFVALMGEPIRETMKKRGRMEADYSDFKIIYSSHGLIEEIEIYPGAIITYKGKSIFDDHSVRKQMLIDDGSPFEISGVIVLLNLGISMWGLDDSDDANKSITVFIDGVWGSLMKNMKPILLQ